MFLHWRKPVFLFASLLITILSNAQMVLADVTKAFNTIDSEPQKLYCRNGLFKIPGGGHLQGIQALSDSLVIITASSGSYAYYITAQFRKAKGKGQINKLEAIAEKPFRHAGGCQVNGNKLFVGVEDNISKSKSQVMMISFNDSLRQMDTHVITHRQGQFKRSTAGAVGSTKTQSGQYLIAVGDWDSKNIDFYLSKPGNHTSFDSLTTFHAPDGQKWCSYQSINLLTDAAGNIYLIGFGLDGVNNRADLYKVQFEKTGASLQLINTRYFKCKGGAGFRYGSGIRTTNNRLAIYSCSRNTCPYLTINIFSPMP